VSNRDTKAVLGKAEMAKVKDVIHEHGMLITVSGMHGNVLRLQPPLSITQGQIDQFIAALRKTLESVRASR
jgi:4-aminobutyrate aminotransferase-like enzyme